MWLDVRAKLAEIEGRTPATIATTATKQADPAPRVAEVASVATPQRSKPALRVAEVAEVAEVATPPRPKSQPAPPTRADGLEADAGAYLDRLRLHGPATYGAMAAALGWGATRAWRAEAKLRAAGLVRMGELGRAETVPPRGGVQTVTPSQILTGVAPFFTRRRNKPEGVCKR